MASGFSDTLRQIYADYLNDLAEFRAKLKPTDGLMGFGKGLKDAPCHAEFAERLEKALAAFADGTPSPAETAEALGFIFDAPQEYGETSSAYWMLIAVHSLTEALVRFLTPEDASAIHARYVEQFPKHSLLPAQAKLIEALRAQSGVGAERKRGLFGRKKDSR